MSGANTTANNGSRQLERQRIKAWVMNATFTSILYTGFLLIEALFFGGDMKAAVTTIAVGSPIVTGSILTYYFVPRFRAVPLLFSLAAQLAFLIVGALIQELEFYFFFQLLIAGAVFATKNFKLATMFEVFAILINILAILFYVPRFSWLNDFRFFMQFAMYVYGSLIMLAQTYHVARKEGTSNRALAAFTSLLHSTPNLMAITDAEGKVLYLSDPMARFIKYPRKDFAVGQPIIDLISDKGLKLMFAGILDADNLYESITAIDIDGEEHYFKIVSDKMTGDIEGIFIDISDITPTIRSNLEAKDAQLAAEAANESKSNFLARMSHEIRTPMNAILGMAEIALREGDPAVSRQHILTIKEAGTNLLSIINDILDFSKIESGKFEVVPGEYLVPSLINDVISIIRMRIVDTQLLFVVNIDSNIPSALYGDEIRIRQILLNLLSNAVKYTEKGYISLAVSGEQNGDNVTLVMSITDTGKGIRPEDMGKLFGNFEQVDLEANRGIMGTGLGLAISRSLAQAMGGDISVVSEYGKGSTFTVTLPQKIRDGKPLASIENAGEKRVLVYELRKMYETSIAATIDNLKVSCTLVSSDSEFRAKITGENYNYVFIASNLYAGVRELCGAFSDKIKVVLLAGFGETVIDKNLSILAMPVYSTSVANILNGVADIFAYNEIGESVIGFTAPEASILIVDDIKTNLIVAEGLLAPYGMRVVLCGSGADAIAAATDKRYDLILMDHMMPDMDGIEATAHIRALDDALYNSVPVVALTANAVSGTKDMFLRSGFNDFLSKPIDLLKLNGILEKWIPREKQIKDAAQTDARKLAGLQTISRKEPDPKLLAIFRSDAEKAVATLRKTMENGDVKLFTTTVHAMKSALANIRETEKSEKAFALEQAGHSGDLLFIRSHTAAFIQMLESLIQTIDPSSDPVSKKPQPTGDQTFLSAQLAIIKAACEEYDDTAVYEALDRLEEKIWEDKTTAALKNIRNTLFLHSDFGDAFNQADTLFKK